MGKPTLRGLVLLTALGLGACDAGIDDTTLQQQKKETEVRAWLASGNPNLRDVRRCMWGAYGYQTISNMCSDWLEDHHPAEYREEVRGMMEVLPLINALTPTIQISPTLHTLCMPLGGGMVSCSTD